MKVIDNFLPSYQFNHIQSVLMGDNFPWYYNEGISYRDDGLFQYKHTFYNRNSESISPYLSLWDYCLKSLKVNQLWRIKVNSRPKSFFKRSSSYHTDDFPCPTTAVFYINTCNGYTQFKKDGKIKSVENRMVIFDATLEPAGVTCTEQHRRVVVNFNYG